MVAYAAGNAQLLQRIGQGQLITVVPELRAVIVISSRTLDDPPSIEDHLAMMDAAIVPGLS